LTHARVIGFLNDAGAALPNPAGLNSTFELTMTARFTETVTSVSTPVPGLSIVTFATVPSVPGFLNVFHDASPDSVDVSGSGFNDGNLILSGTQIGAATSLFAVTSTSPVALDQAGANDYTGQLTLPGTGSSGNLPVDALTQDSAFFITPLNTFGITFANISLGLPFVSVDPSDCFTALGSAVPVAGGATDPGAGCINAHINAPMSAQDIPLPPGVRPTIGLLQGPGVPGNIDFVAQSDFNSPLAAAAPEPASLALLGLGLGALGWVGARRRRSV
jgi:hypothetical protein